MEWVATLPWNRWQLWSGIRREAWEYRWSSVDAHIAGANDGIVDVEPLLKIVGDWKAFLQRMKNQQIEEIEKHERTGRPLGDELFMNKISKIVGRDLKPKKTRS